MTREEIATIVAEYNEEALLADGLEEAFIGVAERCGQPTLAVYDAEKCVTVLMNRDGMERDEAEEFLEFNTFGAWMGPGTPLFLHRIETEITDG